MILLLIFFIGFNYLLFFHQHVLNLINYIFREIIFRKTTYKDKEYMAFDHANKRFVVWRGAGNKPKNFKQKD
jgi:hypothetical protein